MKRIITAIADKFGISVGRTADTAQIRCLIERLHPVTTDKKLIRIGGDGDGGYLVPDDLDGIVAWAH